MRPSAGFALPIVGVMLAAALGGASAQPDHDRAREALRAGRILPLERIVELAKGRFGGDVLDVELEDEEGGLRYELKVMGADGRILKLEYDATTGDLLRAKGRGQRAQRRLDEGR